jgi:hypothetical protein
MKDRRVWFLVLGLLSSLLLAFLLRGLVREYVILPLAQFIWYIKGYYGAFPQSLYWIIILAIAALIAITSLVLPEWDLFKNRKKMRTQGGNVQVLAFWIERLRHGTYPRWYIAHELARIALDLVRRHGGPEQAWQLRAPDWSPPESIQSYLESGLGNSYAEFSRHEPSASTQTDDQLVFAALEYLEKYMESDHEE